MMTLPLRHPSRPANQGNLIVVTVLNLLQKCFVHFCSQFNIVTGASALPRHPSRPPLTPSLIALLPPLEAGQMVYRARRKHLVVCAWPRANTIPDRSFAHFDTWALSQLRLHKPFRAVKELYP